MKFCPLMSFAKQHAAEQFCLGEDCAMAADGAGECLIQQALQCYVSAERTRIVEETERLRRQTELVETYWKVKKDGNKTPFRFLQDDNENLTPVTEVQLRPPAIDGSYTHF